MSDTQQSLQPSRLTELSNRPSSWRQVYLSVHKGKDTQAITKAVMAAENAIYKRLQELNDQSGDSKEREQLKAAADDLLAIRTQKLGWPSPLKS